MKAYMKEGKNEGREPRPFTIEPLPSIVDPRASTI